MNKLSLFAVIASVSLAVPALAQTPSDLRNGRGTVAAPTTSSSEVRIDHADSSKTMMGEEAGKDSMEKGTKHHHKHKHHGKKHHHKKHKHSDEAKSESKSETKGDKEGK